MSLNLDYKVKNADRQEQSAYWQSQQSASSDPLLEQTRSDLVQLYLKRKFNIEPGELPAAMQGGTLSGDQGQELGLTPAEVEEVNKVCLMSPQQLRNLLTGQSNSGSVDGIEGSELKSGSEWVVKVGPPHPKMSMANFFHSISRALETVMLIKGNLHIADATVQRRVLKEIDLQVRQKIDQMNKQTKEIAETLRSSLKAMRQMRMMMYVVTAITALLTAFMIAAGTVASAGTLTPLLMAAAALAIAAVTTSAAVLIASMEAKRKGRSLGCNENALYISLIVISAVASLGQAAIAMSSAAAATKVAQEAVKKGIQMSTLEILETIAKESGRQLGSLMLKVLFTWIAHASAYAMQLIGLYQNMGLGKADSSAQSEYNGSDAKSEVDKQGQGKIDRINKQFARGEITIEEQQKLTQSVEDQMKSRHSSHITTLTMQKERSNAKKEQAAMWAFMGASLGAGLLGAFLGSGASAATASSQTVQQIAQATGFVAGLVSITNTVGQAELTIRRKEQEIEAQKRRLPVEQLLILLEALKQLWDNLLSDLDQLMQATIKSQSNLIAALSHAFTSSGQALDKMMQAI